MEEKSPTVTQAKIEDPIMAEDKKLVAKLTSKTAPHHHLQLSSMPKGEIKASGKKPLWRR